VGGSWSAGGSPAAGGGFASGGSAGCRPGTDFETDREHCGRCDHSCLGGECVSGVCQAVVLADLGKQGATALALDREQVFWASPLQRMTKLGAGVAWLAETSDSIWGVAVDEEAIYWTSIHGGLFRLSKSGGQPALLHAGGYRVAVDATHVFTAWNGVWKMPKTGGVAAVAIAPVGGQGIAVDDGNVYFSTWSPGGLWRVGKNGESLEQLAAVEYSSYVAEYADRVYWTSQGSSTPGIRSVPKTGGPVTPIATGKTPYGIAADAAGVYWVEFDAGSVWMQPAGGRAPILLASGQFHPRDLAVDERAVYWTNDAIYSAISRVAKP
jgi:hypothetical protein